MVLGDEKVQSIYEATILNERKFDLGSGTMGNGVTIWNRAKEVHGDYEKIAHINPDRKITYYIKNPPKQVIDYVEKIAKGKNFASSTSQPHMKVFKESIEDFIDDSMIADKVFKDLEIAANDMIMKDIIPKMKKIEEKLKSKHGLKKQANMSVKNFGTAYIHDIFRQILGQQLLSVMGGLKRISR